MFVHKNIGTRKGKDDETQGGLPVEAVPRGKRLFLLSSFPPSKKSTFIFPLVMQGTLNKDPLGIY